MLRRQYIFAIEVDQSLMLTYILVDGDWSDWSDWQKCSKKCGGGSQNRQRSCSKPAPQYLGKDCEGEEDDVRGCNDFPCEGDWRLTSLTLSKDYSV